MYLFVLYIYAFKVIIAFVIELDKLKVMAGFMYLVLFNDGTLFVFFTLHQVAELIWPVQQTIYGEVCGEQVPVVWTALDFANVSLKV